MADSPRRPSSAADDLPEVAPPNAGFLVQLFLVPAVIVGIIVCVYLAFYWLAHLGNDPEGYIKALQRNTKGRWQAALNFADDLRGRNGGRLKNDPVLAAKLAAMLGRITDPALPQIGQAAVEAIALLADNLRQAKRGFPDPAAVNDALFAASRSDDATLRSRAAYAIGVAVGPAGSDRLMELLVDGSDNVRYNAAIGLARQGNAAAWETLGEMLALPDVATTPGDESAQARRYKRVVIVVNALRGVGLLIDAGRAAPEAAIVQAITALEKDPAADVREAAAALQLKLGRLATPVEKAESAVAP